MAIPARLVAMSTIAAGGARAALTAPVIAAAVACPVAPRLRRIAGLNLATARAAELAAVPVPRRVSIASGVTIARGMAVA